jgi:hypothetical protein
MDVILAITNRAYPSSLKPRASVCLFHPPPYNFAWKIFLEKSHISRSEYALTYLQATTPAT